jgi:hypothetical protein
MEKKELRIGNLVWHVLLGESKVLEIRNDGISICNPDNDKNAYFIPNDKLYQIEPIQLTEKGLMDFGFEKTMAWTFAIKLKGNNVLVYYLGEKGISIGFKNYSEFNCQHVHQLQNLYFALTGKEL